VRLSSATLGAVAAGIARPEYDRDAQATGIVHIGIGAFHRAHQAWYTDRAMAAGGRDWAITGVSMRSPSVAQAMNPQDGLYTLGERSAAGTSWRVIGAVRNVIVACDNFAAAVAAIADPATRIVSFTITEKGYCRSADGTLDFTTAANGIYPLLTAAFVRRAAEALPGLTLLCCDNLADNGSQLSGLMQAWLAERQPDLLDWFVANCTCLATMIDRIVPATTPADLDAVEAALGVRDEAAVVTEQFSQWVIEDRFVAGRPDWGRVGAQLIDDVRPYEIAKLRMLNGAHSALAYLGLARGHMFVHQAMADREIRPLVERLMLDEALPTIDAAPGQDLRAYAAALLRRFENPALDHRLAQIAEDSSQKLPQRWFATLEANRAAGSSCPALVAALGAWLTYLTEANGPVIDPARTALIALRQRNGPAEALRAILQPEGPLAVSGWHPTPADFAALDG
jgi:fructuronate reductase